MNLKDLIDEVNSALDYNPDLEAYKSQVSRVINRHYLQISSQFPWLFRQKTVPLTLRADINSKQVVNSSGGTDDYNVIQVGEKDHYDASNVLYFEGFEHSLPVPEMLGNVIVFKTYDTVTEDDSISHGASEREFKVTGIFDAPAAATGLGSGINAGGHTGTIRHSGTDKYEWPDGYKPKHAGGNSGKAGIVIDRPIIDPSTITKTEGDITRTINSITKKFYTDWTLEFRKYYLPHDCVEVLGIVDRGLRLPVAATTATKNASGDATGTTSSVTTTTAPDRGRLIFIDSAKEEQLYLDRDTTGDPVIAVEGMPTYVTPPMEAPFLVEMLRDEVDPDGLVDGMKFTLSDGTTYTPFEDTDPDAVFGLSNVVEYEYCYTFIYEGVESSPSPIARLPVSQGDTSDMGRWCAIHAETTEGTFRRNSTFGSIKTLDKGLISDTDYRPATEAAAERKSRLTGRVKRFYRRKVTHPQEGVAFQKNLSKDSSSGGLGLIAAMNGNIKHGNGRWMHIGDCIGDRLIIDTGAKQTRFSDETEVAVKYFPNSFDMPCFLGWPSSYQIYKGFWTYHDGEMQKVKNLDECGPRQSIRVYRPPSQDMNVEIRYLSRPKRLVANGDSPEWPPQYHHLLVYMTLKDVCLQHGMTTQAQLYERKSDELLYQMKQKYLTRTNRKYVRKGFDRNIIAGERFGVPTKV